MLKVSDGLGCPSETMKNNKPTSGKPSGNIIVSRSLPQGLSNVTHRPNKTAASATSNLRKASSVKARINACSSSQESLTGVGSTTSSVRRKITSVKSTAINVGPVKSESTPIRMISNLQSTTTTPARKTTFKRCTTNMRRAVSKDSVDFTTKDREKENVKVGHHRSSKNSNNCITILQMEKEKVKMEQQISELVKNAEIKKAEIATLKMEINKLKDLKSDDAVVQLKQELEGIQLENQALKDRLVQLGVPLESTALSDNQKEQILIQRSLSGSFLNLEKDHLNASLDGGPKSLDAEVSGGACGVQLPPSSRSLSEWERGSSSSLSEMSVACLQDRIMQMEETHHSTNEELQATLQELTDLQDQLVDLQLESERRADEKAVLLESLCSQTEKLEECRMQVAQLKQLLFTQGGEQLTPSEREAHLLDLLKQAQEAHDALTQKQEELTSALQAAQEDSGPSMDLIILRDRVRLLESTIESINADKRLLDKQLDEDREVLAAGHIETSQLKMQLENEQQKVLELQREREAGATSELNSLLQETRKDKEAVEERALRLQEQLALSQREVARFKDQLQQIQEESLVSKNNAHKQITDLEYRIHQLNSEKDHLQQGMSSLDEDLQQLKLKCQHHLEDKRDLKATIGELQKAISDKGMQLEAAEKEVENIRKMHAAEVIEWKQFQADLLTTVRVANDFKTEAMQDVAKIALENKDLRDKNASLVAEISTLKVKQEALSPTKSSVSLANSELSVLSNVEKDLQTTSRRLSSIRSDRGAANQSSVRSLIESIENATKHVKGQGPSSSCSSSSSSLNSITSDSRVGAMVANTADLLTKPNDSSAKEGSKPSDIRVPVKAGSEGVPLVKSSSVPLDKVDGDNVRPLASRPVSILTSKLDPIRRNSYGDISEKKDPLSSLVKGGGSKRNALLKWCQNKTLGYKAIDITNFSSSWNDGLAFCAILHSYLPNSIPYEELDSKDKKRNFTLAFQAAESVGIPTTLNINDLITQERPDWQSIMSYVTTIYKHFET